MQEALLIFPGQMIVDCSVTGKGCGLLLLTITKTKFSQSSNRAAAGAQEVMALTRSVSYSRGTCPVYSRMYKPPVNRSLA